jgi:HEAT repeat protein
MPLIKRTPASTAPSTAAAPDDRHSPDPEQRRRAVRSLDPDPRTLPVLAEILNVEQEPTVREAAFSALVAIGGTSAPVLLPFLRSDDAGLRNGAVEALQTMPEAVRPLLPDLLADADPDLRLMGIEIARALPPNDATDLLCRTLEQEAHINVCAAAVDVLADIGTPRAVPTLQRLSDRIAAEPFLSFAITAALARLSGTRN